MSIEAQIREVVRAEIQKAFEDFSPKPDRPRTMSIKQAAEYAGVPVTLMRNIVHRADFDAVLRVGNRILIVTDKFDEWLNRTVNE